MTTNGPVSLDNLLALRASDEAAARELRGACPSMHAIASVAMEAQPAPALASHCNACPRCRGLVAAFRNSADASVMAFIDAEAQGITHTSRRLTVWRRIALGASIAAAACLAAAGWIALDRPAPVQSPVTLELVQRDLEQVQRALGEKAPALAARAETVLAKVRAARVAAKSTDEPLPSLSGPDQTQAIAALEEAISLLAEVSRMVDASSLGITHAASTRDGAKP